ncbi:hypothetical protein NP233_g181 [Leucocoprinus birnbaumii]|uniref:Uncharacterized protein n=1 Tax=Leucocoprinus birnbaumii TaxID=56174 RepID=A0AAD5Z0G9_9AGAR|nr:hypothetical protein NP233_g181 [Leucocoprinus birnbaumii]
MTYLVIELVIIATTTIAVAIIAMTVIVPIVPLVPIVPIVPIVPTAEVNKAAAPTITTLVHKLLTLTTSMASREAS